MVNPDFRLTVITQDDPDNRILECALEAGAEYLITGDHHLLNLQIYQDIKVVNPAAFLKIIQA